MISYGRQYLDRSDINSVLKSLKNNLITQGPEIQKFENSLKNKFGSKFCCVVSSGTAALHLSGNALLSTIDGFQNLTTVDGIIINNSIIENVDTFSNLTSIDGELEISENALLADIDGFANLTIVEGYLQISENDLLSNVNGFANLTKVGEDLYITNSVLENIDGFTNLTTVGGSLELYYNILLLDQMVIMIY